jgi:hypothetical protein
MHLALTLLLAACSQFAHVKTWSGSIQVTYDRTVKAPWALEHSYGSSATTTHYTPSVMSVIAFNGYDETWQGRPSGTAHIVDELTENDSSRPVRLEGSGPVLADPPLGKFGPEQFWINSEKCVYGFYSSAAVHAMHSRDGAMVDGIDVHVENIPLRRSGALSGSRHFHVPNPTNYRGGDQFHIPCLLVEWCSRDAGPGNATVSWSFVPGAGAAPHATPSPKANPRPKCPNADRSSGSSIDRLRVDFEKALLANGHAVSLGDIAATPGALPKISVRLDGYGRALPSQQCIDEGIANGSVPAGSQFGAQKMLLASVQQAGNQTRVTLRIVDVSTGAIQNSALADAHGTGDAAIQQAATAAIGKVGAAF